MRAAPSQHVACRPSLRPHTAPTAHARRFRGVSIPWSLFLCPRGSLSLVTKSNRLVDNPCQKNDSICVSLYTVCNSLYSDLEKFALGLKPPSQSIRIIPASPPMGLCVTGTRHETVKNSASYPRMDTVWIRVAEKPRIAQTVFLITHCFIWC